MTRGWVRVAHLHDDRKGPFEECEDIKRELDETHRAIEVRSTGECYVEEAADDGERWVRVATVDAEYGDDPAAADYLAEALEDAENYRVVWWYGENVAHIEVRES